jgi:2-oxoisovalerate dehydrogenase E1 component alpha subunit
MQNEQHEKGRSFFSIQYYIICYSSRLTHVHSLSLSLVSSPLGTQLPQAVGAAYRLKLSGKKNIAMCFFGEGAASTTDFHSALNFAATLKSPVVFFCRNNGYAISTPVTDQYCGDGVISRAPGYGMAGSRIDGNDIFAVHAAVREAKEYALKHNAPVLIEAMTYRMGHHSTSDDSSKYRSAQELKDLDHSDPLARLENFLKHNDWLTDDEAATIKDEEKNAVLRALVQAERRPGPPLESLFEDVYHEMPPHLQEQQAKLREHLAKYPNRY